MHDRVKRSQLIGGAIRGDWAYETVAANLNYININEGLATIAGSTQRILGVAKLAD